MTARDESTDELVGREKEEFDRLIGLVSALSSEESDRATILIVAAWLEEHAARLLDAYLLPGPGSEKLLRGSNAPLGTFAAKVHMCHALGLLDDRDYQDINIIRSVRNDFAHRWKAVDFKDQSVADRLARLWTDGQAPLAPRERLARSVGRLFAEMLAKTNIYRDAALGGRRPGLDELDTRKPSPSGRPGKAKGNPST